MEDFFEKYLLKSADERNVINEKMGAETGGPCDSSQEFGDRDSDLFTPEDIPGLKRLIELSRLTEWPKK